MEEKKQCLEEEVTHMPLIGDKAPHFVANTTQGQINFPEDFSGKWVVLFSHPADFTPVCSTEFMTFASMAEDFKKVNTELVGLSIDSLHSHIAWLRDLEKKSWKGIENLKIDFPLIDDVSMDVSRKYGMLHSTSKTSTIRAVFVIDDKGIVRTILYYPASTGRNMCEIMRIVVALQKADKEKIATPANWKPGDDVIVPPPATTPAARERMELKGDDINRLDWYLTFRKDNK
jgi:peroxiredoxin (alkyl hydroperoxide reductase subunit C)